MEAGSLLALLSRTTVARLLERDIFQRRMEDEDEGQWSRARREIMREARKRVPELQVVIAYSQMHTERDANETRAALLAESAQRLRWQPRCMPTSFSWMTATAQPRREPRDLA